MRFSAIFLLSLLGCACVAQALDDSLPNDDLQDSPEVETAKVWRRYTFHTFPGSMVLKGVRAQKSGSAVRADAVAFHGTINQKVAITASYWNVEGDINTVQSAVESLSLSGSRYSAGLRVLKLLEYNETNNVSGFQPGQDTILSEFGIDSVSPFLNIWRSPVWGTRVVVSADGTETNVRIARLCTKGFVFCMNLYTADRPVLINGRLNVADTLKVTFEVDYWNTNNSLATRFAGSKLALIIAVGSSAKRGIVNATRTEVTGEVDSVNFTEDGAVGGGFNWERNVETLNNTDGTKGTAKVHVQFDGSYNDATVSGGWDSTWTLSRLVYSFGVDNPIQDTKVIWDPDMAIDVNYDALDSAACLAQPLIVLMAAFMTLLAMIL